MDNVIYLNNNNETPISIEEAGKLLGMDYHTAYKHIITDGNITYFDYGNRNKKVSKEAVLVYKNSKRIQGKF